MDIDNIGKNNKTVQEMIAKARGLTISEWEKKQLDGFTDLKLKIKERISELSEV